MATPPKTCWAISLPVDAATVDLVFHGVPSGLHPCVFAAACAEAGVAGLANGRIRRRADVLRVTLADRCMLLLLAKYGVAHFSQRLRAYGWRCAAALPPQARGLLPFGGGRAARAAEAELGVARARILQAVQPGAAGARAGGAARVGSQRRAVRGLRVGSWNVRGGLAAGRRALAPAKALELLEILRAHNFDVVAVQETSQVQDGVVRGDAYYAWYADERPAAANRGLGFFVRECSQLRARVSVGLPDATCTHCLWLRVAGGGAAPDLYIGNVYLPTAGQTAPFSAALAALQTDTQAYASRGKVVLLGDFNAPGLGRGQGEFERVGQHGELGAPTNRGLQLRGFLGATNMYVLNGRRPCATPEWTRVQPLADGRVQRSVLDLAIADVDVLARSWQGECLRVLQDDLQGADHLLLQLDVDAWGPAWGSVRRQREPCYRWRLEALLTGTPEDRLAARARYEQALEAEAPLFAAHVQQCMDSPHGDAAMDSLALAWVDAVTRAATLAVGRRRIIPGVSKPWWDVELREAVAARRAGHARWREVAARRRDPRAADLWTAYLGLRRRCKHLAVLKQREHRRARLAALEQLLGTNPRSFWRQLSGLLGTRGAAAERQRVAAVRGINGLASEDAAIAGVFKEHYARLACPGEGEQPPALQQQLVQGRLLAHCVQAAAPTGAAAAAVAGGGGGMAAEGGGVAAAEGGGVAAAAAAGGAPGGGGEERERRAAAVQRLDQPFTTAEVGKAMGELGNGKAAHDDGIPNELLKYGGEAMAGLACSLFNAALACETAPGAWRDGTIINLFKSGDRADPGNYRGITLLATVGKLFCRCIHNRLAAAVQLHEGQAGFRAGRACVDHTYTLSDTILQRKAAGELTYVFYLDVRKAFDSTWHDGLWHKLLDKGVDGRLWRTMRNMYGKMRSRVLVNGVRTDSFPVLRGTAQGCTLSPLLFDIFMDGLLEAVESAGLGVQLGGARLGGLLFADDFAGLESSPERLQLLIDTVHGYLHRWGLRANVVKSAVVVYGQRVAAAAAAAAGGWSWGGEAVPTRDVYKYLGVLLHSDCTWRHQVDAVLAAGRARVAKYGRYLGERALPRDVRLLMYKTFVRPVLECGSEVWTATATQSKALEGIQLQAVRAVLGCFAKTASVAVLAEAGLESLEERRRQARVRWYGRLRAMGPERLPARVYAQSVAAPAPKLWRASLLAAWSAAQGPANPGGAPLGIDDLFDASGQHFQAEARARLRGVAELERLRAMGGHSTLQHLPHISLYVRGVQPYLKGRRALSFGTTLKMRCRIGTLQVNALLHARTRGQLAAAPCCALCGEVETVSHFMLHCPAVQEQRTAMFSELRPLFSSAASFRQFRQLGDTQQGACLLSDKYWGGNFTQANRAVCDFLSTSWVARQRYMQLAGTD